MKFNPYSPSKLDVATCGHSFINEYGQKERVRRESIASARGSAAHEVLERISKEMIAGKMMFDHAEVRAWIVDAVTRHPAAYGELDEIMKIASIYINKPIKFAWKDVRLEQNLAVRCTPEDGVVTGAPMSWNDCAYDDPRATIRGRIDILMVSDDGNSAVIYDHKTQYNIEKADTFQMGVYAWIVWKTYPFLTQISSALHFARWGSLSEMYTWTLDDLKAVENELLTKIEIIERREDFNIATPHKGCTYCHHITSCPVKQEFIDIDASGNFRVKNDNLEILGDTNKALKLAGLKIVLDEFDKRIVERLKAHVEFAGPLASANVIFEFRGEESVDFDYATKYQMKEYMDICKVHGEDHMKYVSLNATASKSVWKSGKEAFVEALSKLFKRKTKVTFKGYKS